jgi:hypothetical protein
MAIDLAPSDAGTWRSIALDPMPAGDYELRLTVEVSGDQPISLRVAIEAGGAPGAAPLAASESVVPPTGSTATVTLPGATTDRNHSWSS